MRDGNQMELTLSKTLIAGASKSTGTLQKLPLATREHWLSMQKSQYQHTIHSGMTSHIIRATSVTHTTQQVILLTDTNIRPSTDGCGSVSLTKPSFMSSILMVPPIPLTAMSNTSLVALLKTFGSSHLISVSPSARTHSLLSPKFLN